MQPTGSQKDLVCSNLSWALWGIPTALLVIGGFVGPFPRMFLWTPALLVAGGACIFNAARCGRFHCHITGPLYLIAAVATVLVGLELVTLKWSWIALWIVGGTLLAYIPEWLRGKYLVRTSASEG